LCLRGEGNVVGGGKVVGGVQILIFL
jgi:hypothetical protein